MGLEGACEKDRDTFWNRFSFFIAVLYSRTLYKSAHSENLLFLLPELASPALSVRRGVKKDLGGQREQELSFHRDCKAESQRSDLDTTSCFKHTAHISALNKLLQEDSGSSLANALALLFPRAQCLPKANCISLRKINKSTFHIISSPDNSNELSLWHYWELMTACFLTHQLFPGYHKFPGTVVNNTSPCKLEIKTLSRTLGQTYSVPVPPGSLGTEMSSQINTLLCPDGSLGASTGSCFPGLPAGSQPWFCVTPPK